MHKFHSKNISFSQWIWIGLKSRVLRVLHEKRCWTWTQFAVPFEMTMMYLKLNCLISHHICWELGNPRIIREQHVNLQGVTMTFFLSSKRLTVHWFDFLHYYDWFHLLEIAATVCHATNSRGDKNGKYCFQLGGILSLYHRLIWWYLCQRKGLDKDIQWNIPSISTLHINKFSF